MNDFQPNAPPLNPEYQNQPQFYEQNQQMQYNNQFQQQNQMQHNNQFQQQNQMQYNNQFQQNQPQYNQNQQINMHNNMQKVQPNNMYPSRWSYDLYSCCGNLIIKKFFILFLNFFFSKDEKFLCLKSLFCFICQEARNHSLVGDVNSMEIGPNNSSCFVPLCCMIVCPISCCVVKTATRMQILKKLKLNDHWCLAANTLPSTESCNIYCCCCCAQVQETRELNKAGISTNLC